jgi:hypothetical protein
MEEGKLGAVRAVQMEFETTVRFVIFLEFSLVC